MAQAFDLTAQLQLQSPGNVNQVINDIRRQLRPIGVQVNIQNTRNLARANKDLAAFSRNARNSNKNMSELNRTLQESARRFSVITIATGSFLALANSFKKSVKEAVAFERELVRISQVTGKTVSQLSDLSGEVTRLSTALGASSSDLLNVARTLTQAGFAATETRKALDILAKTSLGATFDNIQDTTEGAIALLRQFGNEAKRSGGDIKFLESSLDAINSVSKRFAVESGDLISAIRRTGGVFAAAGGSVNELIALFTSVRATTRESAETIATGLRTIFTRIQRVETIEQLKALNIQLQDSEGRFVGAFEAIKRLSEGLKFLDPRDFRFSQVVEELGGFRQIGKVIPLINQFATAQEALNVAQGASGSVSRDALVAQQSLGVQVQKVREQFDALIRKFADSSTFRSIAGFAINLAEAFIKVADSLEPLLPLLVSLVGLKLGQGIAPALAGIAGIGRRAGGTGPVTKFARGGMVPGSGNRDTVPAMLTPGEFVIRKSSVNKLGAGTLAAMNENRFAPGGRIEEGSKLRKEFGPRTPISRKVLGSAKAGEGPGTIQLLGSINDLSEEARLALNAEKGTYGGVFLRPQARDQVLQGKINASAVATGIKKDPSFTALEALAKKSASTGLAAKLSKSLQNQIKKIEKAAKGTEAGFVLRAGSLEEQAANNLEDTILGGVTQTVRESTAVIGRDLGTNIPNIARILKTANIDNVTGNIFEAALLGAGVPFEDRGESSADFDFPKGLGQRASLFGLQDISGKQTDAKSSFTSENVKTFTKKVKNVETKEAINLLKSNFEDDFNEIRRLLNLQNKTEAQKGILGGKGKDLQLQKEINKAQTGVLSRNSGGGIAGSDTVPALLTPGEFVFNKSTAQSIGYSNLNRMNKQGVQGYAAGGIVGFERGGSVEKGKSLGLSTSATTPSGFGGILDDVNKVENALKRVGVGGKELETIMEDVKKQLNDGTSQAESFGKAFDKFKNSAAEAQKELEESRANPGSGNTVVADQKLASSQNVGSDPFGIVAATKGGSSGATLEKQAAGDAEMRERLIQQQKQEISAIAKEIRSIDGNVSAKDALIRAENVVRNEYGVLGKEIKDQSSSNSKLDKAFQKTSNSLREFSQKIKNSKVGQLGGKAAQALSGPAGQAFAGQASQMAGAAQQFVFLGASVAALTGQMSGLEDSTKKAINEVAGFATSIVGIGGTLVQVLTSVVTASSQAGIANQLEAKASLDAGLADEAQAISSRAAAAAGLAKSLGAVAIAVVAVGAALKFFSSKAKAEADELTKGVSDRLAKVKEEGGTVGGLEDLETAAGKRQLSEQTDPLSLRGGGSLLGGAAAGAAIGAFFGPVGIAVGGALGAVAAGTGLYATASGELSDATKQQIEAIKGNIGTLEGLYNSSLKADQALADIDATRGLTSEDKASRLTEVSSDLGGGGGLPAIKEANMQLRVLASTVGKRASELQESDFEGEALLQFQTATAQAAAGQENIAKRAKVANDALSEAISATDGTKGFNELIAEGGTFAQAFRQAREATIARTQAEVEDLQSRGALQTEIDAARKRGAQQLQNLTSGTARVVDAQKTQREELIKAKEAAAAFRAELAKGKAFTASLEAQGRALERQGQAIDDFTANLEGRSTEFKAQEIVGLDNVGEVQNLSRFFAEIDNVAAQAGPEAQKSAEALKKNAKILKGSSILEGIDATVSNLRETVVGSLSAVGVSAETFGGGARGKSIFDNIVKELEDGAQEAGGLTKESIDKALSPVAELVDQQANNFKLINNNQNAQLANYSKFLDAQDALFNKELEGRSRIAEVAAKGAELRAKARGEELSPQAQEAARRRQAQVQLAGTGLRAGDVRQVSTAKQQAKQALANIQAQKAQANAIGLSVARRKELAKQERQQLKVIKAANGELERLADQSDRASSILSQIDEERQKRQVQFDLLQEFVVGGQEERGALNEAALGIQNAIKTGTLQGQSAEQRSATVGLLDRLENIVIPGTLGLTGKEVKQELVFRDAISLGLDPKIAQEIATATSKEEQLINSLDRLTNSIEEAARARALAGGGLVQYRANGGSIFQPKGTDTVPAMLTPGEFVIRKSAVDKVGVGALQAINNGSGTVPGFAKGGVIYRQQGGGVPQDNQINALNQQISGGKVNIVGRDKIVPFFKSAIYDNLGAKGFLSLISQSRGDEFQKLTTPQKREFAAAINNRSLPIESFRSVAAVESLVGLISDNSNIFDSAGGGSFTLRAPNFADPASVRKTLEIYKNINTSIKSFSKNPDILLGQKILKPLGIDLSGQFSLLRSSLVSAGGALSDFLSAKDNNQAKAQAQAAFGFASKSKNIQSRNLQQKIKEIEKAEKENKIIKPYKNKGEQARALKNLKRQLSAAGSTGSVGSIVQLLKLAKGGQVPYFASGGGVGGDSVPAMLTPGEFVMNANTVKKHGVGFMNRLNKGNLPGFNKGGVVGGVQYKQDGGTVAGGSGSLTVETSRIQGVFDGFVSNFSSVLDNIVAPFNNVVQNLNQLSQAFGNLTMQHTVNVEGLISVGGLNIDSIKNELSQSIGEMVAGEVQRVMNDQQKNFKSN